MPVVGFTLDAAGSRTPDLASGFPRDHIGLKFDGTNYTYRRWEDLWAPAGSPELAQLGNSGASLAIRSMFDNPAGLYRPPEWWGGTWHNWPNTNDPGSLRVSVDGQLVRDNGILFGHVRSHDYSPNSGGSVRWHALEAVQGTYYWDNFDKFVGDHSAAGRIMSYVLGFIPPWATTQPSYDNGQGVVSVYAPYASNPPDSMTTWANYCSAVATRAAGRVAIFEVWNEPNASGRWFNGTVQQLAAMQRVAYQTIKGIMPSAIICAPAYAGITSSARTYFDSFYNADDGSGNGTKAKDWIDAHAIHTYYNSAVGNWQTFPADVDALYALWTTYGLQNKPVYFNEVGMSNPRFGDLTQDERNRRFARMVLVAACFGFDQFTFYDMEGSAPLKLGFLTYQRGDDAVALWNGWRSALLNREVTRVNFLWNGQLAIVRNGQNYLI